MKILKMSSFIPMNDSKVSFKTLLILEIGITQVTSVVTLDHPHMAIQVMDVFEPMLFCTILTCTFILLVEGFIK